MKVRKIKECLLQHACVHVHVCRAEVKEKEAALASTKAYILHIKALVPQEGVGVQQEERGRLGSKVLSRAEMDFLPEPLYTHAV